MHVVSFRVPMTNCTDEDLSSMALDLFGTNHGIVTSTDYAVTQNSPTGMSVLVAAGKAYVYCSSLGFHMRTWLTAQATATIDSNSSGSTRIDLICIKIDTTVSANADADNVASIAVVKGTPGAGAPATPANHFKLAEVTVADGATSIITSNITDYRTSLVSTTNLTPRLINGTSFNGSANIVNNFPQGFLINGKIVPSVASNNLTVAIKGMDGNDPSASNPVYCRIGDVVRSITAALSTTANAANNWFNSGSAELATKEVDYFVYLGVKTADSTINLGFGRIPYARIRSDFNDTWTNEKYCGDGLYALAATDPVENIGRFAATLSAGAGYTWTVPTFTTANLIQRPIYETRYSVYVPTGPTNTTLTGRYMLRGNTVSVHIKGVVTGTPAFTNMPKLPFTTGASFITGSNTANLGGVGGYLDAGTANRPYGIGPVLNASSPVVGLIATDAAGDRTYVSATSPITWANNDIWYVKVDYEI